MKAASFFACGFLILSGVGFSSTGGEMPDLVQTDPKGNFAREGKSFCGPVAVSNSLMALLGDRWKGSQYELVNRIASEEFMDTDPVSGTGPNGIMQGLRKFLVDQGMEEERLAIGFQGWRSHSAEFSDGVEVPSPEWIAEAVSSGGSAWVNVGWYRREAGTGDFLRVGGHWVTVVGVEEAATSPTVIIHDPAPRAGLEPWAQAVELKRLKGGTLKGKTRNLPRPATGFYEMGGDMVIKSSADCAIIDGVVTLRFIEIGARDR